MFKTGLFGTGARLLLITGLIGLPSSASPEGQSGDISTTEAVHGTSFPKLKVYEAIKSGDKDAIEATKAEIGNDALVAPGKKLPLWLYGVESSRDGFFYSGVMVGRDPFNGGGKAEVPTFVVPVIIKLNSVVTGVTKTGAYKTKPGVTYFNPTVADSCLGTKNNVALKLLEQSPIFQNAPFSFGGTSVGYTQYIDAFQRGNFWNALGSEVSNYHVILNPVKTLWPIVINVPEKSGAAVPRNLTGSCSPLGIVDIIWLDTYLDSVVLPALASAGVSPGTLPLFEYKNVVQSVGTPSANDCCILGYHSINGYPIQTYSVVDFDTTGLFPSALQDTGIASHEVGEWANDPFATNPTPLWGNTGQVAGCQGNLEVGDPLTGSNAPPIVMSNGFTYHLQEMVFFSWFFGGSPTGIHDWYSNNATFRTDAGPVCQNPPAAASASGWKFVRIQ